MAEDVQRIILKALHPAETRTIMKNPRPICMDKIRGLIAAAGRRQLFHDSFDFDDDSSQSECTSESVNKSENYVSHQTLGKIPDRKRRNKDKIQQETINIEIEEQDGSDNNETSSFMESERSEIVYNIQSEKSETSSFEFTPKSTPAHVKMAKRNNSNEDSFDYNESDIEISEKDASDRVMVHNQHLEGAEIKKKSAVIEKIFQNESNVVVIQPAYHNTYYSKSHYKNKNSNDSENETYEPPHVGFIVQRPRPKNPASPSKRLLQVRKVNIYSQKNQNKQKLPDNQLNEQKLQDQIKIDNTVSKERTIEKESSKRSFNELQNIKPLDNQEKSSEFSENSFSISNLSDSPGVNKQYILERSEISTKDRRSKSRFLIDSDSDDNDSIQNIKIGGYGDRSMLEVSEITVQSPQKAKKNKFLDEPSNIDKSVHMHRKHKIKTEKNAEHHKFHSFLDDDSDDGHISKPILPTRYGRSRPLGKQSMFLKDE